MKLDVMQDHEKDPWYADGLSFTCTQCGNCCTGGPGYVWISRDEIIRLADYLKLTPQEVVERYCRKIDGKFSLKENRNAQGNYDCVFLKEHRVAAPPKKKGAESEEQVIHTQRVCTIYSVRPLQCRTWPFWDSVLQSPKSWELASRRCPGMNGGKHYPLKQIAALRDAKDWPGYKPSK